MDDTTPRFAFYVSHEAWYWAHARSAGLEAEITVSRDAVGPDGQAHGCDWEFGLQWRTDRGRQPQLRLYSEAWPALLELPHVFSGLARISAPGPGPGAVADLLTVAGLADATARTDPENPTADPAPERRCPACVVAPGAPHADGCDVALCTLCGWRRTGCTHTGTPAGWGTIWTGRMPGTAECERWQLWCLDRTDHGEGLVPVPTWTAGARCDFDALARMTARGDLVWDTAVQQWITPSLADTP